MLFYLKLRNFVDRKTLKSIHHAIFEPPFTLFLICLGTKFKFNLKTICFAKESLTDYIFPKS